MKNTKVEQKELDKLSDFLQLSKEIHNTYKHRYFVYMFLCEGNTLYIGSTEVLLERIIQHLTGIGSLKTKLTKPVKLIFLKEYVSREEAYKEERYLIDILNPAQKTHGLKYKTFKRGESTLKDIL